MRPVWQSIVRLPQNLAVAAVRLYQLLLSPIFGGSCRFHPSCSQYMIVAIRKHGILRGVPKGIWRICRCHPWNPGGEDWP